MSIYGDSIFESKDIFIIEEELFQYMINNPNDSIQEMIFTKKQLQDPETLTKLLKRAETEKDVKKVVDIIFYGLTILEGISVGVLVKDGFMGFAAWIGFIVLTHKVAKGLDKVMAYTQEKRIKQLREKCEKLIKKYENIDNPKTKQIVENCKKTIKAIDDYYAKEEKAKIDKKIKEYTNTYEFLVDIIHGKDIMNEPEEKVFALAKILNIDFKRIDAGQTKENKYDDSLWLYWFGSDNIESFTNADSPSKDEVYETIKILSKYIPEFKDNKKVPYYYAIDDTVFIYSRMGKKFYYGDWWYSSDKIEWLTPCLSSTIFGLIENRSSMKERYNNILNTMKTEIDIIKIVDIKLGYYLLSKAPEGVTPKKI